MITLWVLYLLSGDPMAQPYLYRSYPVREACEHARALLLEQGKQPSECHGFEQQASQ